MKRRIFIAIPVSSRLQQEILGWEKDFENLPVRWLEGKNLHVTLIPPWYEENIQDIKGILKTLEGKIGSFEVEFRKVMYGPDPRRPRLIWAEGPTPTKLLELKEGLERALGKVPEKRPMRLHLTLARFRPEDFPQFSIKELDERVSWRDAVNSFVLMESRLAPGGADYEVLAEIGL